MRAHSCLQSVRLALALPTLFLILPLARVVRADADHLVLTEVVARERNQGGVQLGSPFLELANPTGVELPLDEVYLTTAQDIVNGKFYWAAVGGGDSGGGTGGNFHCRFPAGMSVAAGDTVVIAINGSTQFQMAYGFLPDLELFEDGLVPDQVPEMREIFWGSIGAGLGSNGVNVPALGSAVESVALYGWDGVSDLVDDLDYVFYGADTRVRVDKTGVSFDGPDADQAPSAYAADTAVNLQHAAASSSPTFGRALARRTFAEDGEVVAGGNGLTGHDETSENLPASWELTTTQNPARQPAAWHFTAPIVTAATHTPAAPFVGAPVTLTAQLLSHDALDQVVFRYVVNGGAEQQLAGAIGSGNEWSTQLLGLAAWDTVIWWLEAHTAGAATTYPFGGCARALTFFVAEPPTPGHVPPKLVFTEVCLTPSFGEFVEIYNPNEYDVDLSNYYLTDAVYAPASQFYWRIVEGNPSPQTIGGGEFNDFHARFPESARIAAGDVVTVALLGSDAFESFYQVPPDFELFEDASEDTIPELEDVFTGSIGTPDIAFGVLANYNPSNNGEVLILYYWDGTTDLVTDIDVLVWGSGATYRFSKNGVSIDGPDADTVPTAYAPETVADSIAYLMFPHTVGMSYTRTDFNEGNQAASGGNGVGGRDELSENWNDTYVAMVSSPGLLTGTPVVEFYSGAVALGPPTPNPFNPRTKLSFVLPAPGPVQLAIFDLSGRHVITLIDETLSAGRHDVTWDGVGSGGARLSSGTYFARLVTAGNAVTTKLTVIK
jgi:hypothetical protein